MQYRVILAAVVIGCGAVVSLRHLAAAEELPAPADLKIEFVRDVQPLLAKHCWSCHGPKKQESGLRLDRRDLLLLGGDLGLAVEAGKSASSRLIHYVAGTDPDHTMPPDGEPLSREEVGVLRAWIDQGLEFPAIAQSADDARSHWAYRPLKIVNPPAVQRAGWGNSAIDQFVLAALEQRGLPPSPEADRTTLIRRLSLDLLGLLPSVAEVDEFVHDARPNAYELLVDRLLQSPHFGERWGRHWLDMARYADSDGYEKDNPRPDAYLWRDWVINAINADMPFDQFTIAQLAGDLLPEATPLQRLATAFHRQTLTNTEGGTDQEQFRVEACFDRTETTGSIWLGLTVGCARCHSHKYDAITQREYYQLFAVFNNGDEQTGTIPKSPAEVAAYAVAKQQHDAAVADLTAKLTKAQADLGPAVLAYEERTKAALAESTAKPLKLHALEEPAYTSDAEVTFQPQADGSVLLVGKNPERAIYTVTGKSAVADIRAIRLDVLPDDSLPAKGPGRVAHGNYVLSEVTVEVAADAAFTAPRKLELSSAKADFEQGDNAWPAKHVFDGDDKTGWAIAPQFGKPHWLVVRLKEPLHPAGGTPPTAQFVRVRLSQQYGQQHTIGRFKLSLQTGIEPGVDVPAEIAKVLAIAAAERNAGQNKQLLDHVSSLEPATKDLLKQLEELRKKEPPKPELSVRVFTQRVQNPRQTFVLKRGEFLHPIKEREVQAAAFATLPPLTARQPGSPADRLDLARWLVAPENPLTPRVTVNHVWRQLFGQGLVRSSSDFGVRGEQPSHPELLDWLAAEFIRPAARTADGGASASGLGWSRKQLIKQIVMSATYRQAATHRSELLEHDPQNVWLARQNRLRVEGEIVRDISLDAAGLLSRQIGGPSVFPPLPPGIAELSYAGNFTWKLSQGNDRYRRGMYTFFKRTAPHPNLTTFDCPDANLACLSRQTSNTPLQALTVLNNETFTEAARGLAARMIGAPAGTDAERLAYGFRICLARQPAAGEVQAVGELLAAARDWYRSHPEEAKKLVDTGSAQGTSVDENAAWISTARVFLNLDEFITRE